MSYATGKNSFPFQHLLNIYIYFRFCSLCIISGYKKGNNRKEMSPEECILLELHVGYQFQFAYHGFYIHEIKLCTRSFLSSGIWFRVVRYMFTSQKTRSESSKMKWHWKWSKVQMELRNASCFSCPLLWRSIQKCNFTYWFAYALNLVSHIIRITYINIYYLGLGIWKAGEWLQDLRSGFFNVNCVNIEELHIYLQNYTNYILKYCRVLETRHRVWFDNWNCWMLINLNCNIYKCLTNFHCIDHYNCNMPKALCSQVDGRWQLLTLRLKSAWDAACSSLYSLSMDWIEKRNTASDSSCILSCLFVAMIVCYRAIA
jgi:hypothetical protein